MHHFAGLEINADNYQSENQSNYESLIYKPYMNKESLVLSRMLIAWNRINFPFLLIWPLPRETSQDIVLETIDSRINILETLESRIKYIRIKHVKQYLLAAQLCLISNFGFGSVLKSLKWLLQFFMLSV